MSVTLTLGSIPGQVRLGVFMMCLQVRLGVFIMCLQVSRLCLTSITGSSALVIRPKKKLSRQHLQPGQQVSHPHTHV